MENKRITMDELSKKLVSSKKIMNKVDTGEYEKGNIDESKIIMSTENLMEQNVPATPSKRPVRGNATTEQINNSRLPDAIKKAMIENPIQQITLNDNLDMDFVAKTKRLMEQDGVIPKTASKQSSPQFNTNDLESRLVPIIENIIRKTLDEKLNQILAAQQSININENLVIKVGNSIFQGKITKVKTDK